MTEQRAVIEGSEAVWAVGYSIRRTLAENAQHIRETKKSLRLDRMPGAIRQGLKGSLTNAEELQDNLWAAFENLPEALRPDRRDQRYSTEDTPS